LHAAKKVHGIARKNSRAVQDSIQWTWKKGKCRPNKRESEKSKKDSGKKGIRKPSPKVALKRKRTLIPGKRPGGWGGTTSGRKKDCDLETDKKN